MFEISEQLKNTLYILVEYYIYSVFNIFFPNLRIFYFIFKLFSYGNLEQPQAGVKT